jgi:hypothetical protein
MWDGRLTALAVTSTKLAPDLTDPGGNDEAFHRCLLLAPTRLGGWKA